jgi:hypothetical protein
VDSGGGTTLAQISIGRTRPYYFVIHLWPTPADVRTYQCDFTREILDLAQDTDEPLLPTDYHDLLAIGARLDEYERMDDSRSARAQHEWTERYRSLQYFLHARASERLIPMPSHGRLGYSNLGGWFPADGGW